jgi:hypothetical protein
MYPKIFANLQMYKYYYDISQELLQTKGNMVDVKQLSRLNHLLWCSGLREQAKFVQYHGK